MDFEYDLNCQNCIWTEIENHDDYLMLLQALKKKAKYVVIIQYDNQEETDEHIIQARKTLKLIEKGYIKGTDTGLCIGETLLRVLVINDRAGVYG